MDELQEKYDQLTYDYIILEERINKLEYKVHAIAMQLNNTDKHLDYVEQEIS